MLRSLLPVAALAFTTSASQPSAPAPLRAPMRDLQWGQLNFLHTTDTHGWHAGHLSESQYSADWGDYISFTHHLRGEADSRGVDLLVVDTGDRVEGNGLYDASTPKGKYTFETFREQNLDIICSGNHELYQLATADREEKMMVERYGGGKYLASNIDYIDPQTGVRRALAQRYRRFTTKNQKMEVVAFGFLFDFDRNANNTVVQRVEDTIREEWFQQAIREKDVDLFVVIGHVGVRMPEFKALFKAIREQNWYTPIAFFGGHAHVRDAVKFDSKAWAVASGRYFETIGWVSVDGLAGKKDATAEQGQEKGVVEAKKSVQWHRRYIDNNLLGLQYHTGKDEKSFPTEHGRNVSRAIAKARKELKLDTRLGCASQNYWMARAESTSPDSVFALLAQQVLPDVISRNDRKDVPRIAIINTGMIRFDIFKGPFTTDTTYIVSPFPNRMTFIQDVPYSVASQVIGLLNAGGPIFHEAGNDMNWLIAPEQRFGGQHFTPSTLRDAEGAFWGTDTASQRPIMEDDRDDRDDRDEPELVAGYTTKDDFGDDGDDAVHSPISFYKQPNCVQAVVGFPEEGEPDKVDMVFPDFLQPYMLLALKFSGGDYNKLDVQSWGNATFTELMVDWIKANWKGDC